MHVGGEDPQGRLTILAAQLGRVHRLAQHLDGHGARLLEGAVLLVVLLKQALGARVVGPRARCLPAAVVARGVAVVQLKLALPVPAGVDDGHAEWPETTSLCVALLEIAEQAHELLAGNVFVVREEVALGVIAGDVDQDVGVGRHAGDGANHVAAGAEAVSAWPRGSAGNVHLLVQSVDLLGRRVLLQELRRDLALGGEDDAVLGQDANGSASVGDGLEGILDLVQTPIGGEDGCLGHR